jgi:hypothetical protein
MEATDEQAKPDGADEAPSRDARARAYLDLWERQLVWLAVHGRAPAAGTRPPPR